MKVKKVFNNNILCAVDEEGNEVIVTGKGLGFQKHTGESLDENKIEKTYRMVDKQDNVSCASWYSKSRCGICC